MGNTQSIRKINFEDMQTVTKNPEIYLLINTLPSGDHQCCLIHGTVSSTQEEMAINKYLKENKAVKIIIYGKNCNDDSVQKKYQQLLTLGFFNVYAYYGGLFEWLMLQDIYGPDLFPTTKIEKDILKFKACPTLNISLLEN